VLADISRKEHELGKKLFGDEENKRNQSAAQLKHEHILQADALGFSEVINSLKEKSHSMNIAYGQSLNYFSEMKVSEKDITFLMGTPSILPVEKTSEFKLASGFGKRINPFHKGSYLHPGVDFAAARGTAVVATGNGRVITAIHNSSIQAGYGNYIEIEHSNGIISRYSHLEDVKVKPGQKVTKGLVIGIIGMSGGTIAPHVHYEIIRKGKEVDPIPYMLEALSVSEHHELWQAGTKRNQSMD
jgi:murein DD-endopeptidase MepM/ murein hydrolase activator NlpD